MCAANDESLISVMVLGDTGVGKTCFAQCSSAQQSPNVVHIPTIGTDFTQFTRYIDGDRIKFQIWDTAGQERFHTITSHYYRNAQVILVMYDVTDVNSFRSVHTWMNLVRQNARTTCIVFIVGNKIDRHDYRIISRDQALSVANNYDRVQYGEVSAISRQNVEELLVQVYRLWKAMKANEQDPERVLNASFHLKNDLLPVSQEEHSRRRCCF